MEGENWKEVGQGSKRRRLHRSHCMSDRCNGRLGTGRDVGSADRRTKIVFYSHRTAGLCKIGFLLNRQWRFTREPSTETAQSEGSCVCSKWHPGGRQRRWRNGEVAGTTIGPSKAGNQKRKSQERQHKKKGTNGESHGGRWIGASANNRQTNRRGSSAAGTLPWILLGFFNVTPHAAPRTSRMLTEPSRQVGQVLPCHALSPFRRQNLRISVRVVASIRTSLPQAICRKEDVFRMEETLVGTVGSLLAR